MRHSLLRSGDFFLWYKPLFRRVMKLQESERQRLINELSQRYEGSTGTRKRLTYLWKKYAWLFVVDGSKIFKRILDITVSLSGLILLSPLFFLIGCVIKWYDGGPILFITNRIGKWGREFKFPKFRSMAIDSEKLQADLIAITHHEAQGKAFKMEKDPRVTPVGYFLRKTSLDELPQLWCVLKGEMSLVGPRPPLPNEVVLYSLEERKRLDITPGLTCIWQVSGRSEIPFEQQVKLDLQYIESQSLWLDLKVLLKTIPAVLFGRGAY